MREEAAVEQRQNMVENSIAYKREKASTNWKGGRKWSYREEHKRKPLKPLGQRLH